jgi:hypothetical protein
MIVATKSTSNMRSSFLYLRANAGFGKSFFSAILDKAQLTYETKQSELAKQEASSIDIDALSKSSALLIDEFTVFSQYMKTMTNYLTIAPKYQQTQKVELGLKILMSAEMSSSFSGGVDNQISDRVVFIDLTKKPKKLQEQEFFKEYGADKVLEVMAHYANVRVKNLAEKYSEPKVAEDFLADIREKYTLGNTTNSLTEDILELLEIEIENVKTSHLIDMNADIVIDENKGEIYIKRPKKTILRILEEHSDTDTLKKMRFKISDLQSIFGDKLINANATKVINGKHTKCAVIALS